MRNTTTRPISWKICESEQLKKAINRGGYLAESLFVRMLTSRDNLGRMMANRDFLRGFLYPKDEKMTANEIETVRDILADEGLVLVYKVNGVEYLEFPKIKAYSSIVGNMSKESQCPPPPEAVILEWEQRFNDVYTAYERRMNGVHTPANEEPPKGVYTEGEREGEREGEGEGKERPVKPYLAVDQKKLTSQQSFVLGFEQTYEALSGHKYKHSKNDFITATKLIKEFGLNEVVNKAKILAVLCQRGKIWFAKNGFADFTIGNLSAQWNKILPQTRLTDEEIKKQEYLRRLQEEVERDERINIAIKSAGNKRH